MSEKKKKTQPKDHFDFQVDKAFKNFIRLDFLPEVKEERDALHQRAADLFNELKDEVPEPIPPARSTLTPLPAKPRPAPIKTLMRDFGIALLLAAFVFTIATKVFVHAQVIGPSMEPTISHNDHVFINKITYQNNNIRHGDVIAFINPEDPSEMAIKRVIGLPGDTIEIMGGWLFINNNLIDEPYLGQPANLDVPELTVPEGTVFVLGDNRTISVDSREWGALPTENILGRATFIYWPLNNFGVVSSYQSSLLP